MTLQECFSSFKKSAKRIELLQEYHIDGGEWDSFQDYIKGKKPEIFAELSEWNSLLKTWQNQKKEVERIRVIDSPLSMYLKYQIEEGYLPSSVFGQTVKFVLREEFDAINVFFNIKNDVWLFDDKYAYELIYDAKGNFVKSREIDINQPLMLYQKLLFKAKSLESVVSQIRAKEITIDFYD